MHTDVFARLRGQDWSSIAKALSAFTLYRLRRCGWTGDHKGVVAKGMSVDDLVNDVILKTIDGRRRWDPEKGDLLPWLRDQIKSEIDALLKSAANRCAADMPMDPEIADSVLQAQMTDDTTMGSVRPESAEEAVLRQEREALTVDLLCDAAGDDRALGEIVEAVLEGCDPKPARLAKYLNVPVDDVYNRMKRFRRKAGALRRNPHD